MLTVSLNRAFVPRSMSALAKPRALLSCLFLLAKFIAVNSASVWCWGSMAGTVKYADNSSARFLSSSEKDVSSVAVPTSALRESSIDIARTYWPAV